MVDVVLNSLPLFFYFLIVWAYSRIPLLPFLKFRPGEDAGIFQAHYSSLLSGKITVTQTTCSPSTMICLSRKKKTLWSIKRGVTFFLCTWFTSSNISGPPYQFTSFLLNRNNGDWESLFYPCFPTKPHWCVQKSIITKECWQGSHACQPYIVSHTHTHTQKKKKKTINIL